MGDERVEIAVDGLRVYSEEWYGIDPDDVRGAAEAALAALESAGYTVAKLEHVGWFGDDWNERQRGDGLDSSPDAPVYRIVEGE